MIHSIWSQTRIKKVKLVLYRDGVSRSLRSLGFKWKESSFRHRVSRNTCVLSDSANISYITSLQSSVSTAAPESGGTTSEVGA
jgi:hypothetical protein